MKGFIIPIARIFVLDQADELIGMDFEKQLGNIVRAFRHNWQSFLFSVSTTGKIAKLQTASLKQSAQVVEESDNYGSFDSLVENFLISEKSKHLDIAFLT